MTRPNNIYTFRLAGDMHLRDEYQDELREQMRMIEENPSSNIETIMIAQREIKVIHMMSPGTYRTECSYNFDGERGVNAATCRDNYLYVFPREMCKKTREVLPIIDYNIETGTGLGIMYHIDFAMAGISIREQNGLISFGRSFQLLTEPSP